MTYKPIYKCRMCGETFYGTPFKAKPDEFTMITGMMTNMGVANAMTTIIREHDMHPCMNGNAGYADLQGIAQIEERQPRAIKATRLDEPNPTTYMMGE